MTHRTRMPATEQRELFLRWRDHQDQRAAAKLVRAHEWLVRYHAKRHVCATSTQDDLEGAGMAGLAHALRKFDPDGDASFTTYSGYWVLCYIRKHMARNWSIASIGAGKAFHWFWAAQRAGNDIAAGEPYRIDGVDRQLDETEARELMALVRQRTKSLDAPLSDGSGTLADVLRCEAIAPDDAVCEAQRRRQIRETFKAAVAGMAPMEQAIAERRFYTDEPEPYGAIAPEFGRTRQRLQQVEPKVRERLRAGFLRAGFGQANEGAMT